MSATDIERRAAELAARAAGPPPESWRPDKPELLHPNPIVGVLERIVGGPDRGWGPTKIAELRATDGTLWSVWLLGHVLKTDFDQTVEGTPRPGDLVAIYYEGRRPKKNPKPGETSEYESYRVVIDGAGGAAAAPPVEPPPFAGTGTAAPTPEPVAGECEACGLLNGHHKDGCPFEIPF